MSASWEPDEGRPLGVRRGSGGLIDVALGIKGDSDDRKALDGLGAQEFHNGIRNISA